MSDQDPEKPRFLPPVAPDAPPPSRPGGLWADTPERPAPPRPVLSPRDDGPPRPASGGPGGDARPPASFGQRAAALLLDQLVVVAFGLAGALIASFFSPGDVELDLEDLDGTSSGTETISGELAAGLVVALVVALVYPWLVLGLWRGWTIGRRMMGIRVVRMDGAPPTVGRAFLREGVTKGLLSFFTLPLIIDFLWPLWQPEKRALHDLVCDTRVVQDDGAAEEAQRTSDAFGRPA